MRELTEFEKFNKCVIVQKHRDGLTNINCKLGLWGVSAPTMQEAVDEAKHYFLQCLSDGEYSSIVGGKDVVETLLDNSISKV